MRNSDLSHHRASDCLTIRKSSLMYGIFIFDFFNIIFIFVFHMNNSDYLQKARKYGHFTGYKN